MNIFPQVSFTKSELVEIQQALISPSVQKYFHSLANSMGSDICTSERKEGEAAESFLGRIEYVKGGLGLINTILQIAVDNPPLPVPATSPKQ